MILFKVPVESVSYQTNEGGDGAIEMILDVGAERVE
jgi:hypothetical protein